MVISRIAEEMSAYSQNPVYEIQVGRHVSQRLMILKIASAIFSISLLLLKPPRSSSPVETVLLIEAVIVIMVQLIGKSRRIPYGGYIYMLEFVCLLTMR